MSVIPDVLVMSIILLTTATLLYWNQRQAFLEDVLRESLQRRELAYADWKLWVGAVGSLGSLLGRELSMWSTMIDLCPPDEDVRSSLNKAFKEDHRFGDRQNSLLLISASCGNLLTLWAVQHYGNKAVLMALLVLMTSTMCIMIGRKMRSDSQNGTVLSHIRCTTVFLDFQAPITQVCIKWVAQVFLFSMFNMGFIEANFEDMHYTYWVLSPVIIQMNMLNANPCDSVIGETFPLQVDRWSALLRLGGHMEVVDIDDSAIRPIIVSRTRVITRLLMSFSMNGFLSSVMFFTSPLLLSKSTSNLEFLANLFAFTFIGSLDDCEERLQRVKPIGLTEAAYTSMAAASADAPAAKAGGAREAAQCAAVPERLADARSREQGGAAAEVEALRQQLADLAEVVRGQAREIEALRQREVARPNGAVD